MHLVVRASELDFSEKRHRTIDRRNSRLVNPFFALASVRPDLVLGTAPLYGAKKYLDWIAARHLATGLRLVSRLVGDCFCRFGSENAASLHRRFRPGRSGRQVTRPDTSESASSVSALQNGNQIAARCKRFIEEYHLADLLVCYRRQQRTLSRTRLPEENYFTCRGAQWRALQALAAASKIPGDFYPAHYQAEGHSPFARAWHRLNLPEASYGLSVPCIMKRNRSSSNSGV